MAVRDAETFEQRKNSGDAASMKTEGATDSALAAGSSDNLGNAAPAGDAGSGSKLGALQPAVELAKTLRKLSSAKERHARLPELMDAVEDAFPTIPDASVVSSMNSLMHIMRQFVPWVQEQSIDPQQYPRYERFCKSATQFSYRITDGSARTGFYR